MSRPDRSYSELWEVTDLIGLRVVTFSEELIKDVAHLIEQSFDVDFDNSKNKLRGQDDRKFGYRSLHYVCALPEDLRALHPDLSLGFRFEVQIRTSLQHTWAEIEHGLGYKASAELPWEFRRRFSQIASLLEIADRDFDWLRRDIQAYEAEIRQKNFAGYGNLALDEISLKSILGRAEIADLDRFVSEEIQRPLGTEDFFPDYLLRALLAARLTTVGSVLEEVEARREELRSFIKPYFEFSKKHWNFEEKSVDTVQRGYSLLFVAHIAALKSERLLIDKLNRLVDFYQKIDYPEDLPKAQAASRDLITQLKLHHLVEEQP